MSEFIICRHEPGVMFLAFNRTDKKNAINSEMYRALTEYLNEAEENRNIKAVVLEGEGESFTSGNDLADFVDIASSEQPPPVFIFLETFRKFPKPIIVAVKGSCIGVGTTLLLHADLVYAEKDTVFSLPFVKLGLCPEFASSYLFPRLAGHARAFEWLVLAEPFTARDALQAGLINSIKDDALQEAAEKAHELTKLPASAVALCKRLLKQPMEQHVGEVMKSEAEHFKNGLKSQEFAALVAEFLHKKSKAQ